MLLLLLLLQISNRSAHSLLATALASSHAFPGNLHCNPSPAEVGNSQDLPMQEMAMSATVGRRNASVCIHSAGCPPSTSDLQRHLRPCMRLVVRNCISSLAWVTYPALWLTQASVWFSCYRRTAHDGAVSGFEETVDGCSDFTDLGFHLEVIGGNGASH